MSVLDQVMNLKNSGVSDHEIIRTLQEQGVSPAEITDALSRAQIKNAVSNLEGEGEMAEGMEPSILGSEGEPDRLPTEGEISDIDLTPPTPIGFRGQAQTPMYLTKEIAGEYGETYEPQEAYYPPPQYPQFQEYPPQAGYTYAPVGSAVDTDTMMEIAEQVVAEKNKSLQKKLEEMNEFRALAQTKLDYLSERLKKIESIIDKLQASILEKVGGYGSGLETVKKEMGMMQDSFGKMINTIADRSEEKHHQHHPHYHEQPKITIHKSKKITRKRSRK